MYLQQIGFQNNQADRSLFVREVNGSLALIVIYVDDLIVIERLAMYLQMYFQQIRFHSNLTNHSLLVREVNGTLTLIVIYVE